MTLVAFEQSLNMKFNNKIFFWSSVALACQFYVAPAVFAESDVLDLQEAMSIAARTHPTVVAKQREFAAASHGLDYSTWQRYPALSASAQSSTGETGGDGFVSIKLDQPLWTWGRITADIDAATARSLSAEAAIAEAEQEILIKTVSTYSEIIRLQKRMAAAEENIAEHERLLELIQRRAKNEINSQNEVIVARARQQQARSEGIQFQAMITNDKADLEQIIGRRFNNMAVPRLDLEEGMELDQSVQAAIEFSPVLHRLSAEMQASEADTRSKRSVLLPQLLARHERFYGNPLYNDSATYLMLNYQLGGGLSALSKVKESEERRNAAEEVADQVRTDWNQKKSALDEVEIYKILVASNRDVYESFVRQFAGGRKTWMEVLNARREATQARYSLIDAEWKGFLSGKRIEIAAGKVQAENKDNGGNQ
jgi:adhesin transport system outer membrane protein